MPFDPVAFRAYKKAPNASISSFLDKTLGYRFVYELQ